MVPGQGGNTAVYVAPNGVVLVDTKLANNGQAILDQVKNGHRQADHPHRQHAHARRSHGQQPVLPGDGRDRGPGEHRCQHGRRCRCSRRRPTSTAWRTAPTRTRRRCSSGKDAIDLYYFGAAHTNGDAFVVFRDASVMHSGDAFANKGQPLHRPNNGGSGVAYSDTMTKAGRTIKNVTTVIPGHAPVMTWQDFVDYRRVQSALPGARPRVDEGRQTAEAGHEDLHAAREVQGLQPGRRPWRPAGNFGVIYGELQKKSVGADCRNVDGRQCQGRSRAC